MKKTDGWMPLYVADYLADTSRLTTEQHGAYFLLIMDYWRNGAPPDDDSVLTNITRMSTAQFRKSAAILRGFFVQQDGKLVHKRIESERARAQAISGKRTAAAHQGAAKRWAKEEPKSMPNGIANGMPNGMPNAEQPLWQNDAPSPSPLPIPVVGIPTLVAEEEESFSAQNACATKAGWVCRLMKNEGVSDVNPGNQTLLTLLEAGATQHEFRAAAVKAVAHAKGFSYALGIVKSERSDASQIKNKLHHGPMPAAPAQIETFKERDARIGREKWEQMTGEVHPENKVRSVLDVVDITPIHRIGASA